MKRGLIKTPADANLQPCCQTCPYHPDFNTNTEEV